jgi:nucleoid DNA-binding protein
MLMEKHGISKRKAEKAVKAVFSLWRRALWRGESVEIPGGEIWVEFRPEGRRKPRFRKFRNIKTGKLFYTIVKYPRKDIRFRPDPALIEPPPKPKRRPKFRRKRGPAKLKIDITALLPKPRPGSAEELRQLYRQMVGGELDLEIVETLVGVSNGSSEVMFARLRLLAERGRKYATAKHLIAAVARLGPR